MLFQYTALMIERELINQHGREQGLKLLFEKLRGKAPWKGKRLFQGKKKQNEEAAADMAPTGAHSKKKKRRKLKKKVVIPVAVVLLAGGWGAAAGFVLGFVPAVWIDRRLARKRGPVYTISSFADGDLENLNTEGNHDLD